MNSNPITQGKFYRTWNEGICQFKAGHYKKAKSLFIEAAEIQEKTEGYITPAVEDYVARCAMKLHENRIAKQYYEGAIESAEHFEDKDGKIDPEANKKHFKEIIDESEKALKKLAKVA